MKIQIKEATAAAVLVELERSQHPAVQELARLLHAVVHRPEDRGRLTPAELGAAVVAIDYARGFLAGPMTEEQHAVSGRARAKLLSQLEHSLATGQAERDDSGMLANRNGTNPQMFRDYSARKTSK